MKELQPCKFLHKALKKKLVHLFSLLYSEDTLTESLISIKNEFADMDPLSYVRNLQTPKYPSLQVLKFVNSHGSFL